MYRYEYIIFVDENRYEFFKENESDSQLRRNMFSDILTYAKNKNIRIGDIYVELTVLYNDEYYDSDNYDLLINSNYEKIELKDNLK